MDSVPSTRKDCVNGTSTCIALVQGRVPLTTCAPLAGLSALYRFEDHDSPGRDSCTSGNDLASVGLPYTALPSSVIPEGSDSVLWLDGASYLTFSPIDRFPSQFPR
jgi:hypothetical protein